MTLDELEWVYAPWRTAGQTVRVSLGSLLRGRPTRWAEEATLLGAVIEPIDWGWALTAGRPGSALHVWTTPSPCWTPLCVRGRRVMARSGCA